MSKITSVEVTNFMAFPSAIAEFDDRGILNFKGFNDSGKSAFLMATAICLLNVYPQDQKSLIRDGEREFQIRVSFDDGVYIDRFKYDSGASLYEMFKDGKRIFTTRDGQNTLGKVEGVPQPIAEYLGLFNDGTYQLHFRRKNDPLLLVETTGRENFEMLNSILKTEELANATRLASDTANKIQQDVNELNNQYTGASIAVESIWATEEIVDLLRQWADKERETGILHELLKGTQSTLSSYETLVVPPTVPSIDTSTIAAYTALQATIKSYSEKITPEIDIQIDTAPLKSLMSVLTAIDEYETEIVPLIEPLDAQPLDDLNKVLQDISNFSKASEHVNVLAQKIREDQHSHDTLVKEAAAQGMKIVTCPSCKTMIEVEIA